MSREKWISVRVTEEENRAIEEKMKQHGILNRGAYIRKMAIDGYCLSLEVKELQKLAALLNVSVQHMAAIEQGRKMCSVDLLVDLSDSLGVSIDVLIKGMTPAEKEVKERLAEMAKELILISASM